jgi:hypothetical protein
MKQLEKPLDDAFKSLPQLPENARKGLAAALPWLTLIGAVLSLLSVANLYNAAMLLNGVYSTFGYPLAGGVVTTLWLGIAILVAQAVLFFVAFPALRQYKKSGWNLLFWVAIVSVLYGVIMNLFNGYFDLGQLIVSLLGAAIGLYFLFQVRPYFTTAGGATPASIDAKPVEKPAEKVETPVEKTDKEA